MPQVGDNHLPFASHWLTLPAGRMHYVDEGPRQAGETLLFVHGNPTWSYHFRRLISQSQDTHRCVAVDHLGMGLSDLPDSPQRLEDRINDLVRVVDELDLSGVTLVAQDWGGAIGLGALLKRRERFNRIVLFNTGAFPPPFIPLRIAACRWPVVGRFAVQGFNAFSRAALRMTLARKKSLAPDVAEAYLAPHPNWTRRRAVYDFVADIPRSASHPTWRVLESIEQELPSLDALPICLIWGMQDWCFTPYCLDRLQSHWPSAEVHRLQDVGHWVLEDASEQAGELFAQFLSRTSPAAVENVR